MGLTIYHDNFSYEALPDTCNYMGPWRYSNEDRVFVDYYAPYNPVSVMHLAGQDLHRSDLDHKVDILDLDDKKMQKSLRYKIQN